MFSAQEKEWIAGKVQEILLSLKHPELPYKGIEFTLIVCGITPTLFDVVRDDKTQKKLNSSFACALMEAEK